MDSTCKSYIAIHTGVQFDKNEIADELTAALLVTTCKQPDIDLAKVRCNLSVARRQSIQQFEESLLLATTQASNEYCKTKVVEVELYCTCRTPWIDGSTSASIYGERQREFNMHECCKCKNWFHIFCLKSCGIVPPKRNAEFICRECEVPITLKWGDQKYMNTCTVDNFLTVIFLYCKQHPQFIDEQLGDSELECAIKGGIKLMLEGKMFEGRTLILDLIASKLNFERVGEKCNCYGGEYSNLLCLFTHIFKLVVVQKCTSQFCPRKGKEVTRYISSFSFSSQESTSIPFCNQLRSLFPIPGDMVGGYCGAEFDYTPPPESAHALNERLCDDGRELYFECRNTPQILQASFLSKKPWMVLVAISSLKACETTLLPRNILLYGLEYQLGGCSLHQPGHFTAVISWEGKDFFMMAY